MNRYIDSEIILTRKVKYIVYVYIMIIIIIVLSLIIVFMLFNYKTYYKLHGIVINNNDHYYIKIYVPLEDIKYITNNNIVIIDNKKYNYKIEEIDKEYFTDNILTYQVITINLEIPNKYKFDNLTLDLKFLKENKKIIDYLLRKWGNMKELDKVAMKNIEGGANPILITGIVTAIVAFISGILNGVANPKKCN